MMDSNPEFLDLNYSDEDTDDRNIRMGLRQREKLMDDLEKENFSLKMKGLSVLFLQETLHKLTPEGMKELVDDSTELKLKLATLSSNFQQLQSDLNQKDEDVDHLLQELESTQFQLTQVHETYQDQQSEHLEHIDVLSSENKLLKNNLREREKKIDDLEKMVEQNEVEITRHREQLLEYDSVSQLALQEIDQLKDELSDSNRKLAHYTELELKWKDQHTNSLAKQLDIPNSDDIEQLKKIIHAQQTKMLENEHKIAQLEIIANSAPDKPHLIDTAVQANPLQTSSTSSECQTDCLTGTTANMAVETIPIKQFEENRQRFIKELKERNLLLVRISQCLDKSLGFRIDSQEIDTFQMLKKSILHKLQLLQTIQSYFSKLSDEKRFWFDKCKNLETRIDKFNKSLEDFDKSQGEISALKSKLYSVEEILTSEREGARRRVNELINTKRDLEVELSTTLKKLSLKNKVTDSNHGNVYEVVEGEVSKLKELLNFKNHKIEQSILCIEGYLQSSHKYLLDQAINTLVQAD
ncbi:hypothetical protein BC833DRAFT_620009 [Globomyces pollinis-pini]|nr:hypothetical protein BC833DRAFT_620009 [Globomyces pollinis-pini]